MPERSERDRGNPPEGASASQAWLARPEAVGPVTTSSTALAHAPAVAVAVARMLACAVLLPAILLGVARLASSSSGLDDAGEASGVGYFAASAVALASQALLLWSIVALARARPDLENGGSAPVLAALMLGFSALILLVIPLAIVVFLVAAVLLGPAAFVAGACAIAALAGLGAAHQERRAPSTRTAQFASAAAWTAAAIFMPLCGGVFVLSFAG